MRMKGYKHQRKIGAGTVIKGLLLGSVVGATVGWLTSPASGGDILRGLRDNRMSAREKAKTAEGNIESQARVLAEDVSDTLGSGEMPAMGRKHTTD